MSGKTGVAKNYSSSRIVAFEPGEEPIDRHIRRRESAEKFIDHVEQWCSPRGIVFRRLSSSDHPHNILWVFKIQFQKAVAMARWNPATGMARRASFITGKRTVRGFKKDKIFDYQQLLLFLESWFVESTNHD